MIDVHLTELKRDPVGVAARVYAEMGLELSEEGRWAMREWLGEGEVTHGRHVFSLADFGLTAERVMEDPVFQDYCEEYGIQCGE